MKDNWNEIFRNRTKKFAVEIIRFCSELKKTDELRIISRQIVRSATSTAANYRAALRGRSDAEKFSKLCIVVEEADETLFWLEILEECKFSETGRIRGLKSEATELVKVMASYRNRLKK